MKAENVLEIYRLIMEEYDKLLSLSLSEIQSTKKSLENTTARLVVYDVLSRCRGFTATHDTDFKVWQASLKAFSIAQAKTNDIDDCENYKKTFRQTYEASLRTELYRQFLALGQNTKELLNKLTKENKPSTSAELIKLIFNEVNTNIDAEVSKFIKIKSALIEPDDKNQLDTMKINLEGLTTLFQTTLSLQRGSVILPRKIGHLAKRPF